MNYNCRRTLFFAMACLLCVAGYAGASTRATSGMASDGGTAHLIVYRIPTIGKFVIVQVYVDDVVVGGAPCLIGAGDPASEISGTSANNRQRASRPNLQVHRNRKWFGKLDSVE
jgi:hypothetical protein